MTAVCKLSNLMVSVSVYAIGAMVVASVILQSQVAWHDRVEQQARESAHRLVEALNETEFTEYVVYHKILPQQPRVGYRDEAWFKSDSAVISVPDYGFRLEWREKIVCDHDPYDDDPYFEYYAGIQTTETVVSKLRARPDPEKFKKKKGFPAVVRGAGIPVRYPTHDADCKLVSYMTQYHEYGLTKKFEMESEIVQVRGS